MIVINCTKEDTNEFQARAGGWGEPSSLWNPAVGARPKSTSWGESPDTWNLNRKVSLHVAFQLIFKKHILELCNTGSSGLFC